MVFETIKSIGRANETPIKIVSADIVTINITNHTSVGKSIQTEISSGPRRGLRLPTYDIADRILLVVIRMCRNEYIL